MLEKIVMFPTSESNGFINERSYSGPDSVLQGVCPEGAACTLLLSFGCSILWGQSSIEAPRACSGQSLVLGQYVVSFN